MNSKLPMAILAHTLSILQVKLSPNRLESTTTGLQIRTSRLLATEPSRPKKRHRSLSILFLLIWPKISGACRGYTVKNGSIYPAEVLEGSTVTVTCNQGFEVEGSKILECKNGKLQDSSGSGFPTCVHKKLGLSKIHF